VFTAMVVEAVRPHRTDGHGSAWRPLMASHHLITTWMEADLTAVAIHDRLGRRLAWALILHRLLQPALLCVADLPPDHPCGHRRLRGGVGLLLVMMDRTYGRLLTGW
jgi:hypothetical protein